MFLYKFLPNVRVRLLSALIGALVATVIWAVAGWALTLLYVMVGWVWFLLPTPQLAGQTLIRLFSF